MISRAVFFWCSLFALSVVFLVILSDVILPFVVGFILAYLLNPIVSRLETYKIPRPASSILFIVLLIIILIIITLILYRPIVNETNQFIQKLPVFLANIEARLSALNLDWLSGLLGDESGENSTTPFVSRIIEQLHLNFKEMSLGAQTLITRLYDGGLALVDIATLLFLSPIIAAYLLADWHKVSSTIHNNLPRAHQAELMKLWGEINLAFSGFIRGQSTVCLSLAVFYAVTLTLIDLPFSIVIGLLIGLLSFIPFVGSIGGFIVSMIIGLTTFWGEWFTLMNLVIIFAVGQILEGYVLAPKLIGDKVALHPVWMMFSLFAFGYLFGFIGLLIAVPLSSSIGILLRYGFRQYRKSNFYLRPNALNKNQ